MAPVNKRKNQLPHDTILEVLLHYKDLIIFEDGSVVSQKDPIWAEVTQKIGHEPWINKVVGKNAYSYVASNACQVRVKLNPNFGRTSDRLISPKRSQIHF